MTTGHVGGTRGLGILSSVADVLRMIVVRGMSRRVHACEGKVRAKINSQVQGKVSEFLTRSVSLEFRHKVREKSGNFELSQRILNFEKNKVSEI